MKILVDEIVTNEIDCPFSVYHTYPLIADKPGYYTCDFTKTVCILDLDKKECNYFKESQND